LPSKMVERALGLGFQMLLQIMIYEERVRAGDSFALLFLTLNIMIILSLSPVMLVVSTTITQNILIYLAKILDSNMFNAMFIDLVVTLITINSQAIILIL